MNQRTVTVNTILSVLKNAKVQYDLGGSVNVSEVFNDTHKEEVRRLLVAGFKSGDIEMTAEARAKYIDQAEDDKPLRSYVTGLINNWVRKAPEFNSGSKYQPKNPGARAGSQDESIVAMTALLKQTNDPKNKQAIQEAIDARKAELMYAKQPQIDATKIPSHLRHLVK